MVLHSSYCNVWAVAVLLGCGDCTKRRLPPLVGSGARIRYLCD
jgi:hypothetical protein